MLNNTEMIYCVLFIIFDIMKHWLSIYWYFKNDVLKQQIKKLSKL